MFPFDVCLVIRITKLPSYCGDSGESGEDLSSSSSGCTTGGANRGLMTTIFPVQI